MSRDSNRGYAGKYSSSSGNKDRRRDDYRYNDSRGEYSRKRRYSDDDYKPDRPIKQEKSSDEMEWGKKNVKLQPNVNKEKPNFETTGKLTEDTNKFKGVVIKYSEPQEARLPKRRWRLYPFKGEKELPVLYIHRQSAFLLGRDRKIADIPLDHPSCSKQHAALQYRLMPYTKDDGTSGQRIRPYLMDLESANGTFINNKKIEPRKYYELLERDVIKFGYSSREYVLLHEHSKDSDDDDDVQQDEPKE